MVASRCSILFAGVVGRMVANWRITAAHGWQSMKAKIKRGFVSEGETFIIVSLALGDFAKHSGRGRARKAVTRDVPSRRLARHKQICIALSFTTYPGNTAVAASQHLAETFLWNVDPPVGDIDRRSRYTMRIVFLYLSRVVRCYRSFSSVDFQYFAREAVHYSGNVNCHAR